MIVCNKMDQIKSPDVKIQEVTTKLAEIIPFMKENPQYIHFLSLHDAEQCKKEYLPLPQEYTAMRNQLKGFIHRLQIHHMQQLVSKLVENNSKCIKFIDYLHENGTLPEDKKKEITNLHQQEIDQMISEKDEWYNRCFTIIASIFRNRVSEELVKFLQGILQNAAELTREFTEVPNDQLKEEDSTSQEYSFVFYKVAFKYIERIMSEDYKKFQHILKQIFQELAQNLNDSIDTTEFNLNTICGIGFSWFSYSAVASWKSSTLTKVFSPIVGLTLAVSSLGFLVEAELFKKSQSFRQSVLEKTVTTLCTDKYLNKHVIEITTGFMNVVDAQMQRKETEISYKQSILTSINIEKRNNTDLNNYLIHKVALIKCAQKLEELQVYIVKNLNPMQREDLIIEQNNLIGFGTHGNVKKGVWKQENQSIEVAVKSILCQKGKLRNEVYQEAFIMR
jgi:hypothetical protein